MPSSTDGYSEKGDRHGSAPEPGTSVIDLVGCARCGGDGHLGLVFRPLAYPVELRGEAPLTHWAPCPTNGEPILMRSEST